MNSLQSARVLLLQRSNITSRSGVEFVGNGKDLGSSKTSHKVMVVFGIRYRADWVEPEESILKSLFDQFRQCYFDFSPLLVVGSLDELCRRSTGCILTSLSTSALLYITCDE